MLETYGKHVEQPSDNKPDRDRRLLKTGWKMQNLKNKHLPDKRLLPADQYLAGFMMDAMLAPLKDPEHSVIVSIFTPCELIQEAGLFPYNVEGFSCYLNGSRAEQTFLRQAEQSGLSETLCSYHKTFVGAVQKGLLSRPKCIVYTNLTCDANLLTFRCRTLEMDLDCTVCNGDGNWINTNTKPHNKNLSMSFFVVGSLSAINQFTQYNFFCSISDVIHGSDPSHSVTSF